MRKNILYISLVLVLGLGISATVLKDKYFEIVKNIEIFSSVYKELNFQYVDEIDPAELMHTGITAMVGSLDPYTNYYSESKIESYRINKQGRYEGLGILMDDIDGNMTLTVVTEGGPAYEAGLRVADIIQSINGTSVIGKSKEEINQIMRGAPGTVIRIQADRPGKSAFIDAEVSRTTFNVKNVPVAEILDDKIAYVALTKFSENAGANVEKALRRLSDRKDGAIEGIILDLRDNGGGFLREAIKLSNVFIPRGKTVVTTKGKIIENDKKYDTKGAPFNTTLPLTILINDKSASASEIVSGVVQDYDRGVLIGQRSFGKGLVQHTKQIGYNAQLKLTTAKYYIPSGRCIQSAQYEDGKPVNIPDAERTVFKTNNGRKVLDGGGVQPDVEMPKPAAAEYVQFLEDEHLIFNYVTAYRQKNDSIAPAVDFKFDAYDDFKNFVQQSSKRFASKKRKAVQSLSEAMKSSALESSAEAQIQALITAIDKDEADDLEEHKAAIVRRIEEEIVSRYYYQKGKILNQLNRDPEIAEAIAVMADKARYSKILKGN